jgi:hypothetical protein
MTAVRFLTIFLIASLINCYGDLAISQSANVHKPVAISKTVHAAFFDSTLPVALRINLLGGGRFREGKE